jgi:hypothetical protein
VPARGRPWTPFPHSSFPRNEGVRGSNPRVGSSFAGVFSDLVVYLDDTSEHEPNTGRTRREELNGAARALP